MREVFHKSLEEVQDRLVEIADLVTVPIEKATTAFATSAVSLAEEVIDADSLIDQKAGALAELNIPTGIPLVYRLDEDLRPIGAGEYLDPEAAVAGAAAVANQGKA